MGEQRKLFIKTYGCQMNVYDSERMAEALAPQGYVTTDTPEAADLILLNTCHIREKAAEKVYSELGRLRPLKALNPDLKIGVAGCVAQAEGAGDHAPPARRRPRRRAAELPPPPRTRSEGPPGHPRPRHRLPRGRQVRSAQGPPQGAARPHRLPHRAGRLRQVLRLLRRPLHPRGRGLAPRRPDPAGSRGPRLPRRPRDHAPGPERERLPRRRTRARRGASPASSGGSRKSTASPASASPPRTRTTWTTT